jgi:thiol:disulfide interchange protein
VHYFILVVRAICGWVGAALLALGLGMGTPLLIIGVGGGSLIPKAGSWMEVVKSVFGVLLLMVAIGCCRAFWQAR